MRHVHGGGPRPRVGGRSSDSNRVSDETLVSRTVHELSSPLTVIGGFTETLLRHHNEMAPSQRERYLASIQRHTDRLNRIVDDLNQLQQARLGRLTTNTAEVRVVDAIVDALQIAASASGRPVTGSLDELAQRLDIELHVEDDVVASVDETHLVRMLANLVENSLKYGAGPRRLTIAFDRTQVVLWIADNGDGIPVEQRERIFDPYERGDEQRLTGVQGSGLGLSIVAELARLNHGAVRLLDTTRGTCFELVLPVATRSRANAPA